MDRTNCFYLAMVARCVYFNYIMGLLLVFFTEKTRYLPINMCWVFFNGSVYIFRYCWDGYASLGLSKQRNTVDASFYNLSLIHISEPTRLGMISYAVFC